MNLYGSLVVFNHFLLMGTTYRSKIRSDQIRIQFGVSLYHLSFYANTPFGLWSKVTAYWHKERTITSMWLRTCTLSQFWALVKMHSIKYKQIGSLMRMHFYWDCILWIGGYSYEDNIGINIRNANPWNWQKGFFIKI